MATPFSFLKHLFLSPCTFRSRGPGSRGPATLHQPAHRRPPQASSLVSLGSPQGPLLLADSALWGLLPSVVELHLQPPVSSWGQSSLARPLVLGEGREQGPGPLFHGVVSTSSGSLLLGLPSPFVSQPLQPSFNHLCCPRSSSSSVLFPSHFLVSLSFPHFLDPLPFSFFFFLGIQPFTVT